jgi:tetratricopeptide (TPR) repeat protein
VSELRQNFYSSTENLIPNGMKLRAFYLDESPDSIYNLGSRFIYVGIKKENSEFLNYGKLILAGYYNKKGKVKISQQNLEDCISHYKKKENFEFLADAYNLYGLSKIIEGVPSKSVNYFGKSLFYSNLLGEESEQYMAQINLAEAYIQLEKYEKAEIEIQSFLRKVTKRNLKRGERKGIEALAKLYFLTDRTKQGILLYEKALKLAFEIGDKLGLSIAYTNSAIAYFEVGNLELTQRHFEKSLALRKEINNPALISEAYFNMGEFYFYNENYGKAKTFYAKGDSISSKHDLKQSRIDHLERIAACHEKSNNLKEAYSTAVLVSSLQKEQSTKSKKSAEKLDLEIKEKENHELLFLQKLREDQLVKRNEELKSNFLILFVVSIVSLGVLSFLFIKFRNKS